MSHYCLEIIMPPVEDVDAAVKQILEPFSENGEDEDGHPNRHAFWDFWVIGGRYSGNKLEAMLEPEKKDALFAELKRRKITVSCITAGKQEISPADQIPVVDAIWCEFFPDSPVKVCPFFNHFNNQYQHSEGFPDVMRLKDIPPALTAFRVIVAGPSWNGEGSLQAKTMLQESVWNGVSHMDCKWDGKVQSALAEHKEDLKHAKPEYAAKHIPHDDWLVVTVDYHS